MAYVVTTRVCVESDAIDELAELFDATNRQLVEGHDDWEGALFTADRSAGEVTVIARWSDPASYERLRAGDEFQAVMARFASRFLSPPSVVISEVLVDM